MLITPINIYRILLNHFGTQDWWPIDKQYHKINQSDPRFEIIIGAILTQNTAWKNVEKALTNLKRTDLFTVSRIFKADMADLKKNIQSTGFFNQKATRLKMIVSHLHENFNDDLDRFFNRDLQIIRKELLLLNGIGPETADSILLYAGNHPIFVVDAYTKRICKRLPVNTKGITYEVIQHYFQSRFKEDITVTEPVTVYKEMHALIVSLAKNYCKKKPDCKNCPMEIHCLKKL